MTLYSKLHGGAKGSNQAPAIVISAVQFLGLEPNVNGYATPDVFLAYAKSLRPQEIEQLEQAFDFMKSNIRVIGSLVTRADRSKRNYQHPTFLHGSNQIGCKIILEGGIKQLLQDYIAGKVAIDFSLEELVEVALNG